jgi:ABC-type spermidine/putrescine transport system permease subunit II
MIPASIFLMFPAGISIPYAFCMPGSPSSREANSFSTQSVTADGSFFDSAATSDMVLSLYSALFCLLIASVYVLSSVDCGSQFTPFFRSALCPPATAPAG